MRFENDSKSVVTEFEFDEYAYKDEALKVLTFDSYNSEWFDFVIENRQNSAQTHDYDIVEGPVADDKIQRRINVFLSKNISKSAFLEELKWHEETHQMCFCTMASLQFIKHIETEKIIYEISSISEPIVEQLVLDMKIDEQTASELFFNSQTFSKISSHNSIEPKNWMYIYSDLMKELN
jgi:hypothetical protein